MRGAAGQVAREAHWWLHRFCGLGVLLMILAGLGAWRLSAGPIELPFLASLIEDRANAADPEARLEVGRAEIGWEGWRDGDLMPVRLRLAGVRLRGPDGTLRAELPDSAMTLSLPWLLRGEVAPRTLELRQPALRLRRSAMGEVSVLVGSQAVVAEPAPEASGASRLDELMLEMMGAPSEDTPFGALSRLRITDARIVVEDEALGATWVLDQAMLEIRRLSSGGVAGHGGATLLLGQARVPLTVSAEAIGKPADLNFRLTIPEVQPALLAAAARPLAPLAGLDAATRIEVAGRLGADGAIRHIQATLQAGAGRLDLGVGRVLPMGGLDLALEGSPTALSIPHATLRLAGGSTVPVLVATAEAARSGAGWRGAATLSLDQVSVADLPRYWPRGLGVGHERDWILENVTAGIARNGRWRAEVEAAADLSALRVAALSGTLDVADATVHWLRPIPPVERVAGTVTFGLDEIALRVNGGRQTPLAAGAGQQSVTAREGLVRFIFPQEGQDRAEMSFELAGPIPQAVAIIQHPRLKLFDRRPFPVKDPTGSFEGRLTVAFPLLADLPVEALRIGARTRLRDVRINDVLFGRPLERGQAELTVDTDGLRVTGTGTLGGINARLGVEMDFRAGPPTQVVMRESVSARTDAATIAALGLPLDELAMGPVGLEVRTERRRSGQGRATIRGDLREARMEIAPLSWTKPAGQIATAEGVLRLNGDNLEAVETFRLEAPALLMRGNAAFGRGARLERVTINEAAVEQSRFAGEARPPAREGGPWSLLLRGPVLDLRRTMAEDSPAGPAPADAPPPRTAWAVDARFDRTLLGPGRELGAMEARVLVDGLGVVREGRVAGRAGPRGPFEVSVTAAGAGRAVRVTADDAGALLGSFDVLRHLEGGRLTVNATYAHNRPGAPMSGTAEMSDFAVRNAPGFAKLLQALTFYGLVEALSGPGLGFSRLVAPFILTPEELTLSEARAFSASLGLTAKGTLHRRQQRLAMEGTIVPAYIFNSLLGNIPILGRLFSPETGGGLFAATFRLSGPVDDPQVSVNPLAALTPGFLRGLFGIGQASP